jgi:hypothetical protein
MLQLDPKLRSAARTLLHDTFVRPFVQELTLYPLNGGPPAGVTVMSSPTSATVTTSVVTPNPPNALDPQIFGHDMVVCTVPTDNNSSITVSSDGYDESVGNDTEESDMVMRHVVTAGDVSELASVAPGTSLAEEDELIASSDLPLPKENSQCGGRKRKSAADAAVGLVNEPMGGGTSSELLLKSSKRKLEDIFDGKEGNQSHNSNGKAAAVSTSTRTSARVKKPAPQ